MKKLMITAATILAWLTLGPARADDLPRPSTFPSAFDHWTGFYVGAGMGGAWTDHDWRTTEVAPTFGFLTPVASTANQSFDGGSVIVNGFVGYNHRLTRWHLIGIEADIGVTPHSRSTSVGIPGANGLFPAFGPPAVAPGNDFVGAETPWNGSIRGRMGFLVTPTTMLYGSAGVAFQRVEYSAQCFAANLTWCTFPHASSQSSTEIGWTFGGGVEHALGSNWLVRLDYRASFYGDRTVSLFPGAFAAAFDDRVNAKTDLDTQQLTLGIAYRF